MSENLHINDFFSCLEQKFKLYVEGGDIMDAQLVEVKALAANNDYPIPSQRTPFSLVFLTVEKVVLPQQIYRVENEAMGEIQLFLVPIGQDEKGTRYEALFN